MKKFLLFTLLTLFAMLPFSCSSNSFDEPDSKSGGSPSTDKISCFVEEGIHGQKCHSLSQSACNIIGGIKDAAGECDDFAICVIKKLDDDNDCTLRNVSRKECTEAGGEEGNSSDCQPKIVPFCVVENAGKSECFGKNVPIKTCSDAGGTYGIESDCKNRFLEWDQELNTSISSDSLYINGVVKTTDSAKSNEVTIDSVIIKVVNGSFIVSYEPVSTGGVQEYDFTKNVTPIYLNMPQLDCGVTYTVSIAIYAGDETPEYESISFEQPKTICKDPYIVDFTCGWDPSKLEYGKTTTPSLFIPSEKDNECTKKMYLESDGDTIELILDYTYNTSDYIFPRSMDTINFASYGLVNCSNDTSETKSPVIKPCTPLTIDPIEGPSTSGKLTLKGNYQDSIFYGNIPILDSLVKGITIDSSEEGCGEIEYEVSSTPAYDSTTKLTVAQVTLTPITVNAKVTCYDIPFTIGSVKAWVAPDVDVGDCSLADGWNELMYRGESLTINTYIENSYDRCGDIEYSLTGTDVNSFSANNTIELSSLSDASSKLTLSNITARVTCSGSPINKVCPEKITVAKNYAKIETCHNPRVTIGPGATVLEVSCYDGEDPAKTLGCDCNSDGNWSSSNFFSVNGENSKTYDGNPNCWATASLPENTVIDKKRVLVEYDKEIGCVAY